MSRGLTALPAAPQSLRIELRKHEAGSLLMIDEVIMRKRLLKLREDLAAAAEAAHGSAAIVELDQSKVGRLSRMDAMQAQAMAQASGNRREAASRRIAAALQRLDDGDYGICLECDEPINPRRLEFDPATPLCITCASDKEEP